MKQHITIDQLNELTDKKKKKLAKWWKPAVGDYYVDSYFKDRELNIGALQGFSGVLAKEPYYPLLSIGQMIEFLSENAKNEDSWLFPLVEEVQIDYPVAIKAEYVCNVLWEALKEELT